MDSWNGLVEWLGYNNNNNNNNNNDLDSSSSLPFLSGME